MSTVKDWIQNILIVLLVLGVIGCSAALLINAFKLEEKKDDIVDTLPPAETPFTDYKVVSKNLISDYTVLDGKQLNNVGSTDTADASYKTLRYGIPVEEGKTYGFISNGKAVTYINKVVFKTADNITETDWDKVNGTYVSAEINVTAPIVAPEGSKYMFLTQIYDGAVEIEKMECVEVEPITPVSGADLSAYTMMTLGDSLSETGTWQNFVQSYT